jgi:hypothetical protein
MSYSDYKRCVCEHTKGTHKQNKVNTSCKSYSCECQEFVPKDKPFSGPIAQYTPNK